MHYLWITRIDPKPERDGQRIYSGRLIEAIAEAGAHVDVLCFASEQPSRPSGVREGRVQWWPTAPAARPAWAGVFSSLPNIAYRSDTPAMRQGLQRLIRAKPWDAIVLDGLYAGWALPAIEQAVAAHAKPPRLIYVSHNHEESTRAGIADNFQGNALKRAALKRDADKVRVLERRMVARSGLVTAITPEDAERYAAGHPGKPVVVMPPGYSGPRVPARTITEATPRRAVLVGSFNWIAKQMNLEEFVQVADPLFAAAGTELKVVGDGSPAFLDGMRRHVRATTLTGAVAEVQSHLADARIAVVPERSGGGFKLKVLDYVFNRLPVAALNGSMSGTPLRPPETLLSFATVEELAQGVLSVIYDLPTLNQLQERAYAACADRFNWQQRGETFISRTAGL